MIRMMRMMRMMMNEYDDDINVDDDELHLGSEHEAKDDGGADSDAHAQARQLHLVRRGGRGRGLWLIVVWLTRL